MKPLTATGTATLQATLRAHNKALGEEKGGFWLALFHSSDTGRIMEAQKQVKLAFKDYLGTNPPPAVADEVKAWLLNNAREPDQLLERLNGNY